MFVDDVEQETIHREDRKVRQIAVSHVDADVDDDKLLLDAAANNLIASRRIGVDLRYGCVAIYHLIIA